MVITGMVWLLLSTCAGAMEPPVDYESALTAYSESIAFAVAVSEGTEVPAGLLDAAGVVVWQQPGVALVAEFRLTDPVDSASLKYAKNRCAEFLRNAHKLCWAEPVQFPGEPANSDEFYLEPVVYLLEGQAAGLRLERYIQGYEYWLELNPGLEYVALPNSEREPYFAVVYLDANGPVEFYFDWVDGQLLLRHFIHFEFFSA